MTSFKIRHFLNNLLGMDGARYLEVGVWKGATFVSALYNNNLEYAMAVDDFSIGGKADFLANTAGMDYTLFEGDAFEAEPKPINIYLYDASKKVKDVYESLDYYYDYLTDEFIYIVDDYNHPDARKGTDLAIKDLGLKVIYSRWLGEGEYREVNPGEWWLGLYVAVLKK